MLHIISLEENKISYIAGKQVKGKLAIAEAALAEMSDEFCKNGIINDKEGFTQMLSAFVSEHRIKGREVTLVLPAAAMIFRELTIPFAAKEKELREMVSNEMLYHTEDPQNYIVDYVLLEQKDQEKNCRVLAFAIFQKVLADMIECFKKAGLSIKRIDVSSNAVSKLYGLLQQTAQTVLTLQVHEQYIDLMLVENGFGVLFQTLRLRMQSFAETGTIDIMADEIADQINRIMQFNFARHREDRISQIQVWCDIERGDELFSLLQERAATPCVKFDIGALVEGMRSEQINFSDYSAALGALILRK